MLFSKRTDWDRQTNALSALIGRLNAQGIAITDLTESNPTRCGFNYPPNLVQPLADPQNLMYDPNSFGMEHVRRAVGRFYDFDWKRVVLTASTSESYSFLFRLLLDVGDKVLVPHPSYPLFQFLLELNDARAAQYPLVYIDGQWRIDFSALEALIDAQTKAVVLVNPNNPTGSYIKGDELQQLNQVCRRHHLAIISDEVFFDYRLTCGDFVSLRGNREVLSFALGGLSKSLALPQMKLGWILAGGPQNDVDEALQRLEIIADTYLSVNTPVQNALPAWLPQVRAIDGPIIERVRTNLQSLTQAGIKTLTVEGGWYAIVPIKEKDEEQFVLDVLERHHILVHPGFFFDFEHPGYVVLSLLPQPSQFAKIVPVLT